MKNPIALLLVICFSCMTSCTTVEKNTPVIDFTKNYPSRIVHLSELLDDIHIIKLETAKDYPISDWFKVCFGGEHLILVTRDKLLQYTSEGKFVRILAVKGRGPKEFNHIHALDVNKKRNLLYISDTGKKGKLLVFNLQTGEAETPITYPFDEFLNYDGIKVMENGDLFCGIQLYRSDSPEFFILNPSGQILYSKANPDPEYKNRIKPISLSIYQFNNELRYMNGAYDTLYTFRNNQLTPVLGFHVSERWDSKTALEAYCPEMVWEGEDYYLLKNSFLEGAFYQNALIIGEGEETRLYHLNKNDLSLIEIESIWIDMLQHQISDFCNLKLAASNGYVYYPIQALDLMEMTAKAIDNNNLGSAIFEALSYLKETVKEDDNPYLLVGKIK